MDVIIYSYEQDARDQPAEAPPTPSNDAVPEAA